MISANDWSHNQKLTTTVCSTAGLAYALRLVRTVGVSATLFVVQLIVTSTMAAYQLTFHSQFNRVTTGDFLVDFTCFTLHWFCVGWHTLNFVPEHVLWGHWRKLQAAAAALPTCFLHCKACFETSIGLNFNDLLKTSSEINTYCCFKGIKSCWAQLNWDNEFKTTEFIEPDMKKVIFSINSVCLLI